MEMRFDSRMFGRCEYLMAYAWFDNVIQSPVSPPLRGRIITIKYLCSLLTWNCTDIHCSEGSLKPSSGMAIIWAEIEPKRWPCWNYLRRCRQVASEGHQQRTWGGGAVVNPQLIEVTFCVKVGKLHFDKEAVWYSDAPTTVLTVGVAVRVVRTCKLARFLPTDRGWAPWKYRHRG